MVGLSNADNTSDLAKPISAATQSALDAKANLASPTFTGTVSGIDKTMVGLSNVDNTSDLAKPISAATQSALDAKANLASPTFTGTPLAPTATSNTNSDQVATTSFVTNAISAATILDATVSVKGKIQLAGDFTGTADLPAIATDAITSTKIKDGEIVNEDISSTAEIQDTKLATIATAGKVSNSATTATELNTGSSIVSRDIYGRFAAGNITAAGLTTSDNINVHGITIGTKGGSNNIGIGDTAFTWSSPIGNSNTVLGIYAFTSSSGSNNTAIGNNAIRQGGGGSGDNNTAVGAASLSNGQAANNNTAIGVGSLTQSTGTDNTALGYNSGSVITTGTQNTFLGSTAAAQNGSESINNATAIGYGAVVNSSNSIQLGNTLVTNIKTSGTITSGSITIPNTDGTVGQLLATNGSGTLAWITPSTTATAYSGVLPVINGGTGSSTQNFVDLTNNQTIDGTKNFSADAVINGITVGRGNFNENSNTAVGLGTLANNAGYANTGVGRGVLASNGAAGGNTALGYIALSNNVSGTDNVAIGTQSLQLNVSGSQNTAIGKNADVAANGISNSVAIGANAIVTSSNTIQLGSDGTGSHAAITDVKTSGAITAASFKVAVGTAAQFLKADGTIDSNNYFLSNTSNIAIGYVAGTGGQGAHSIAIGSNAAQSTQAEGGIGLGYAAAQYDQGLNAVAIGSFAGNNGQHDNSIVINATGTALNGSANAGLYIDPIRSAVGASSLFYDTTTKEITYGSLTNSLIPYNGAIQAVNLGAHDLTVHGITVGRGNGGNGTNTTIGSQALVSNTTGFLNSAFGLETLHENTVGSRNTAIGSKALYFNNAYDNTAVGYLTLQNNTTGSYNVGIGSETMFDNASGGYNTAVGSMALRSNIGGNNNTASGYNSLFSNTSGGANTAIGSNALPTNTTGTYNSGFGVQALEQTTTGNANTAIGVAAIDQNTTGSNNAILGAFAGRYVRDGSPNTLINSSILIGAESRPNAINESNQIVIGYGAIGNGSNTIQLGNTAITDVKTNGAMTSSGYKIPSGTASQYLMADGSVSTGIDPVREVADEFSATASQTSFTLTQTPSANSKVKMYVNGIRISNSAYSVSDDTLTYIPSNNGSYSLSVNDRIQLDYFY